MKYIIETITGSVHKSTAEDVPVEFYEILENGKALECRYVKIPTSGNSAVWIYPQHIVSIKLTEVEGKDD